MYMRSIRTNFPDALPFRHLSDPQKSVVGFWDDGETRLICHSSGKGGGKTWVAVMLLLGDAIRYPGTVYFIAHQKMENLRRYYSISIAECRSVFEEAGWIDDEFIKFNSEDNVFDLANGSKIFFVECGAKDDDRLFLNLSGLSATRGLIEDAQLIEEPALNALISCVGRCKNDMYGIKGKLLLNCAPKLYSYLYLRMYEPWRCGTLRPNEQFVKSTPYDNTQLVDGYIEMLESHLSEREKVVILHGEWYSAY